jgi:hypothetical protein
MNDLGESMRRVTAEPPPARIDLDRLIAAESGARVRRRWLIAGGAGLAVLAVAGVVLVIARPGGGPAVGVGSTPSAGTCAAVRPTPSSDQDPSDVDIPRGEAPPPTEPEADAVQRLSAVLTAAVAAHLPGRTVTDVLHPGCDRLQVEPHIYPALYYALLNLTDAGGTGSVVVMLNDKLYPALASYDNVQTLQDGTKVGWLAGPSGVQLGVARRDGTQITVLANTNKGLPPVPGRADSPATVDELLPIATDPGLTLYP